MQTVVVFLKDKLPPPIASQLDGVLGGQGSGDMMGQAQQVLGGLVACSAETNLSSATP